MKKPKIRYEVFRRMMHVSEIPYENQTGEWESMGDTWAVSEKQAINNRRYHVQGQHASQYDHLSSGGYWETHFEYKAVPA